MQMVAPRKSPITPPRTDLPYTPARYVAVIVVMSTRHASCSGSTAHAKMTADAIETNTRGRPSKRLESPNLLAYPFHKTKVASRKTLHAIILKRLTKKITREQPYQL
jgi:hypothetical protein